MHRGEPGTPRNRGRVELLFTRERVVNHALATLSYLILPIFGQGRFATKHLGFRAEEWWRYRGCAEADRNRRER